MPPVRVKASRWHARAPLALLALLSVLGWAVPTAGQQLAFPSAEGFGRFATGGRGGSVCKVTNLNDSGAGSLRTCLGQTGPRTIVFAVSGLITLTSAITTIPDHVTIACQSAPGQGVLIKGTLKFWDTENVIMRFCRIRPPPPTDATFAVGVSAVGPYAAPNNLIFDHLSIGWIYDDMLGLTIIGASQPLHATVQWSLFSESAATPAGEAAGSRGAASVAVYNATSVLNASWLYNLYANVGKRTPHPGSGSRQQIVNQVLHNLSNSAFESIYLLARYQPTIANIVGNWFRSTGAGTWGIGILGCGWPGYTCLPSAEQASNIYIRGNLDTLKRPNTATGSELAVASLNNASNFTIQSTTPNTGFPALPSQTTAELAFPMVMANVGAHKPFRDAIDQRAIADATNDVRRGACPVTPGAICFNYPTYTSGTVPVDTDNDGLPDSWETSHGLNPAVAADGAALASNGYSNLENYLNTLAGDTVLAPTPPPPPVALELTHTCSTPSNTLTARVMGSLFYLLPGAVYPADTLARSQCASAVAITESASVVPSTFALVSPWAFLGTAGPNVSNTCTNCLSVHGGSASSTAAGSGYTLTTFREGPSVSAATGGASAYTALPGLCSQVVEGVVTSTPLWPWPLEARIAAARSLSGSPPANVTQVVAATLGAIPAACIFTPAAAAAPTTWVIARTMASPPGVDGAACTVEAPCATLAHVASRMGSASGQTVYLREGMYSQRITPGLFPPGTSWTSPTIIAAYGGESVTLQLDTGIVVALSDPARDRYLLLDRLTLDGSAATATTTQGLLVTNGAGPIRFRGGTIRNTALERVMLENSQEVELLDTTIRSGTSGVAVLVQGTTHGTRLQRLLIETSPTHGVQVLGQDHTQVHLTQNQIRTNVGTGVVLHAREAVVENTLITGNGAGVQVGVAAHANTLVNNTIADNTGVGLQIDAGASATLVTNALLWGNSAPLVDEGAGTVLTTNLVTDPGFVGSGPCPYCLALATSPAADTGTCLPGVVEVALDGVARPQPPGGACDIGAYERAGGPAPPLPTPGALSARPYGSRLFLVP